MTKHTHDISLSTNSNQTIDMFTNRHQDLSSHMATLLCTRRLILNMNTSRTTFNKELGQLHDSSETAMSRIGIGDDGSEVVVVLDGAAFFAGGGYALFALFSVVEELGHEQLVDFVGDGVLTRNISNEQTLGGRGVAYHRVICEIGRRLICR